MTLRFPDPPAHIHLVGVKGTAMTAMAQILLSQGYHVTGSDTDEVFPTDATLQRLGVPVMVFSAENISSHTDAVIYSTAYNESNVERQAATDAGIPQWSYPEMVTTFFQVYDDSVAVSGSHGKTTTTALLGHMLEEAGFDPTVIVGSEDAGWGSNARTGNSSWFVLEADEYQNKLAQYNPRYAIILNVDYDHPDFFPDRQAYEKAFLDFVEKMPEQGSVVLCGDDPLYLSLRSAARCSVVSYGQGPESAYRLVDVSVTDNGTVFSITHGQETFGPFCIPFAGEHYALNATGAFAMAKERGAAVDALERAINYFRGTARRMQLKGEFRGSPVVDDFAHHPTEITATLTALRARYPERPLVAVFHPHTFSRTAGLLPELAEALSLADFIYLLPIYSSARERQGGVSSDDLAALINKLGGPKAEVFADHDAVLMRLRGHLQSGNVLVTMGAGDVWKIAEALIS